MVLRQRQSAPCERGQASVIDEGSGGAGVPRGAANISTVIDPPAGPTGTLDAKRGKKRNGPGSGPCGAPFRVFRGAAYTRPSQPSIDANDP